MWEQEGRPLTGALRDNDGVPKTLWVLLKWVQDMEISLPHRTFCVKLKCREQSFPLPGL